MSYFDFFRSFVRSMWGRLILGVVVVVLVFWAGGRFGNRSGYETRSVSLNSSSFGGGYADEMSYAEMEAPMPFVKDMILPPEPPTAAGDLGRYDEVGPKIIKTGSINLEVKSAEDTLKELSAIADRNSGFLQQADTWRLYDERLAGSATLRIPSEKFEMLMEEIKALAVQVNSESISGQDVTEEYIDLQSRLENLRAEEAQYLEVLTLAKEVKDILEVHSYLSEVRGEIESIQGQLQYLENRTSFSTISVQFEEQASFSSPTSGWQPFVIFKEAVNQLIQASQGLVNGVIWLVVFGGPVALMAWFGYWFWKKAINRKR